MAETAQEVAEQAISEKLFGSEEPAPEEPLEFDDSEDAGEEIEASEEEPEEITEEEASELFEIQLESGAVYEVPEELKDAFVRQKDYTTKTQEVAAQRKEIETVQAQVKAKEDQYKFMESVQAEVDQAQILNYQIDAYTRHLRENMDNLSDRDILTVRSQVEELKEQKNALSQVVSTKYNEFQQAQEQTRKGLLDKSTEVLRKKIPSWNPEVKAEVKAFGQSVGFTEQELDNAIDPREWQVLWEASQYRKLQSGKAAAIQKVQGAPQIKPKSRNPMPSDVKQKLNTRKALKTAKSDKDKADLIQADLARRLSY